MVWWELRNEQVVFEFDIHQDEQPRIYCRLSWLESAHNIYTVKVYREILRGRRCGKVCYLRLVTGCRNRQGNRGNTRWNRERWKSIWRIRTAWNRDKLFDRIPMGGGRHWIGKRKQDYSERIQRRGYVKGNIKIGFCGCGGDVIWKGV